MPASTKSYRAAQYVRMSTDYQQYSIDNQKAAIATYAAAHGIEIVVTYEDAGKSGLTISGRPALRQLIADVALGQDAFDTILVYDVSRWGRFQDADESAHLEYVCRLGGVRVEYCAEPFSNDGTPFASICKVVKRVLAAEYSRELSVKVRAGKARLAALGFHQGSAPGFGLRRMLCDREGRIKGPLAFGEHKSLVTDRVILVPGPPAEVELVRWMYHAYVDDDLSISGVVRALNQRRELNAGKPWTHRAVHLVLSSPKYMGDNVWGTSSVKLLGPRQQIAKDAWVVCEAAHQAIISRDLFDRATAKRQRLRTKIPTDQELLQRLRDLSARYGVLSYKLMVKHGIFEKVYKRRFGSLTEACAIAGVERSDRRQDSVWLAARFTRRGVICSEIQELLAGVGGTLRWSEKNSKVWINEELKVEIAPVRPGIFPRSRERGWRLDTRQLKRDLTLMDRLDEGFVHRDFFILSPIDARRSFMFRERNEEFIEQMRVDSLASFCEMTRRAPLAGKGLSEHWYGPNPYSLAPPAKGLRYRRRPWKHHVGSTRHRHRVADDIREFLRRRRMVVERVSTAWSLTSALSKAIQSVLSCCKVRQRLRAVGITTAPAILFEGPPQNPVTSGAPNEPSESSRADARPGKKLGVGAMKLLAGKRISPVTLACLSKMTKERQGQVAREFLNEQRWSVALARALLALTPPEQRLSPHPQVGLAKTYAKYAREASKVEQVADVAVAQYSAETVSLAVVSAFARRLLSADASVLAAAGAHRTRRLRRAMTEVSDWHRARPSRAFSRGRVN